MIPRLGIRIETSSLQLASLPEASIFEEDIDHPETCKNESGESIPVTFLKDQHSEKSPRSSEKHSQQWTSHSMKVHFLARNAGKEIHSFNVVMKIAKGIVEQVPFQFHGSPLN